MIKTILSLLTGAVLLISCAAMPVEKYNERMEESGIYQKSADPSVITYGGTMIYDTYLPFIYATTKDPSIKHYTVHINTPGGDAFSCTIITNHIKKLQAQGIKFTMIADVRASSAGFFMWMMGDERLMAEGSYLMIHTMRGQRAADEEVFPSKMMDSINILDENIIKQTYLALPTVDKLWLETALSYTGTTYVSASEALELGLATGMVK